MNLTKDLNNVPLNQAFSFSRDRERTARSLMGLLMGLVADQQLNEMELLFLDTWLKSQQSLAGDEIVLRILSQVGDILEDGQISAADLDQMRTSINSIVTSSRMLASDGIHDMEQLNGFLMGIASDGVLNDLELRTLKHWLGRNAALGDVWPANVLINRLDAVLDDGTITEDERQDLLRIISQVTGVHAEQALAFEATAQVWEDQLDELEFTDKIFCLTGDFVSGERGSVDIMLHLRGADTSPNVNRQVDFLVVGTLADRNWLTSSHGRKIEKALMLKRQGSAIRIITERTLLKFTH